MKPIRFTQGMIDDYVSAGHWDSSLISDSWDQNAVLYPDSEAIVEENSRLSWAEAKKQIDSIAAYLFELGIKRDERVAVQLYNCAELFTFRLACEKAGIVAVTLLPNFRQAEVKAILNHTEAVGIVIPFEFRGFNYFSMIQEIKSDTPSLRHIFVIGNDVPEGAISVKELAESPLGEKYSPDYFQKTRFSAFETFQIATTTGTTGMPKCVEFVSSVRQCTGRVIAKRLKITEDDVVGAFAPVIAGGCFNEVYRAAPLMGARIAVAKYFTPEEILALIERERVTIIATVPAVLIRILEYPDFEKYDVSSLRIVKYGGAALPYDQALKAWEKFGRPVLPAYGGLDVGTMSSSFIDDTKENLLKTVGKPLDGAIIKLIDEKNKEVPEGEVGEVIVKGPHCEPGYFGDPEATKEAWYDGWFHTGDLASFDTEGRLTIRGRRKDMIIRGGQNIYPLEIESMLLKHPKVLKASVIGMPDAEMGEKACAYAVIMNGESLSFSDMVLFMKGLGIAPFKIPERLEIIDDLPLAGGIKVDKKQLRLDIEAKLRQEGILK
ncbi:MAG: AMP-binding protein [Proteobacteria bacterium]|nr:AMP-binding protein [Pseudomonadota bacterium]